MLRNLPGVTWQIADHFTFWIELLSPLPLGLPVARKPSRSADQHPSRESVPPCRFRAGRRGEVRWRAGDAASWPKKNGDAAADRERPGQEEEPGREGPRGVLHHPHDEGADEPPAFPIELMSARPAAAAVPARSVVGRDQNVPMAP